MTTKRKARLMTTLLREDAVSARTGLSRSTIYRYAAAGTFPKQVKLGRRRVAWVESEIEEWIMNCMNARS